MKYKKIALGGTFDHFHAGHQAFLLEASQHGEHLIIGVTDSALVQNKKFAELIEPITERVRAVKEFCNKHMISHETVVLTDIFGPTINDDTIEALFTTEDTLRGGEAINSARESVSKRKLPIIKASLLRDKEEEIISSERIRAGEINRQGDNYHQLFLQNRSMNERQRQFFSEPQGKLLSIPTTPLYRAVVGDSTFETFLINHWSYNLAIADLRKQRLEIESQHFTAESFSQRVTNAAGEITRELAEAILSSAHATQATPASIFVDGEEDLAAVAAVLLLPLNSAVYYGQPGKGIIEMIATEEKKQEIYEVVSK